MFAPDPKALPCRGLPFANCDTRFGHTVVDHTSLLATGLHYTKLDETPGRVHYLCHLCEVCREVELQTRARRPLGLTLHTRQGGIAAAGSRAAGP